MHKILPFVIIVAILGIAVPSAVNSFKTQNKEVAGTVEGRKTEVGAADSGKGIDKKFLGGSINKLQKVEATVKNKEVKSEINTVIEETSEADKNIERSIATMEARPKVIKFIMGPDYKNAGQVRSEIVHLQNQIRKIDKLETKTGASDSGTLAETKTTLQSELSAIETKLYNNLQGYSLFGWLSRLLTGFTPSVSPTPSGVPEASASASPIGTTGPSSTPVATAPPTLVPTSLPTATP